MIVNQAIEADKVLLKLCQLAYKTKIVPEDWKMSTIILFIKVDPQCNVKIIEEYLY